MMNIRGRAGCVLWAAALGSLLLGCGGSEQREFGGDPDAAGQAGQGPDDGNAGHNAGKNAAAGRSAGGNPATAGASTGGRELGEAGGRDLGGAGGTDSAERQQTLSDYLPCDEDSDCPVGFGDCITEVPFNAKDVSGATSAEIEEIIPDLSSAGVCTRPCTNAPESCSDLKLTDSRGEKVSYVCQLVAVGQSPYPQDVEAYPTAVDLDAMAAGVPFGAICRPPFELDPAVPNSLCNECTGGSSCGDGLCYDFAADAPGTADAPGVCLMPCGAKSSCPGGFVCTGLEDEAGESLGRFCAPVEGTCGACIDRDGDGRGIGQCGEAEELITPVDCDDSNPDAYFDPDNMGHAFPASCAEQDHNCNGLSDETEQLSDPETYGSAHCGACGVTCAGEVEHGVARCLAIEGAATCGTSCDEGWADCSDEPGCETEIEDPTRMYYPDGDGDGFGEEGGDAEFACLGIPPEGSVNDSTDCNDADANIHPGADELCDGIDNDCDGSIDEPDAADASVWYRDNDGDGYGDPGNTKTGCSVPAGFVGNDADCDDTTDLMSPAESDDDCDGVDQDCDGTADDDYVAAPGCDPTDSAHRLICVDGEKVCQCVPGEGEDVPGDGEDTNCDGFDGDIQGSIFVNAGVSDGCSGDRGTTPDNPCGDPREAIDRAAAEGKVVIAARGSYEFDSPIDLANGVSIYGGFDLEAGMIEGSDPSVFRRAAGADHAVVAVGANITTDTTLFNVRLEAATPTASGMGTYGLVCEGCTALTLEQVMVVLEPATDGDAGANGTPGIAGQNGGPATEEWKGGAGGGYHRRGGDGGRGYSTCGEDRWYGNGLDGEGDSPLYGTGGKGPWGTEGSTGHGNGWNGSGCSTPELASGTIRLEGSSLWLVDPNPTSGAQGQDGGGAAGGQGHCDYNLVGANNAQGGGGGGGGGQGGFGGGGGQPGGSSVGLVLFNSVGLRLVSVSVALGGAGKGGVGGAGGAGGGGGPGGKGWHNDDYTYGEGGAGGKGGGGCGGTGGSGGFAVNIVADGATIDALRMVDFERTLGTAGDAGEGGPGGSAGDGDPNPGVSGNGGIVGQSCDILAVTAAGLVQADGCQI